VATRAEAVLHPLAAALAVAVLAAYVPLRAGWRVMPAAVLIAAIAGSAALFALMRRDATPERSAAIAGVALIAVVWGALLLAALPDLLPLGSGPDLTHHLVLVNHLERAWRLVDDPALYPYLGDMMDYTPGAHLLIALAGRWLRSDGLHAAHAVLALTVALKIALVFAVAVRVLPAGGSRVPLAVATGALAFAPSAYVLGSFVEQSFWAQAVAELFAVAAWSAIVLWDDRPAPLPIALFALFAAATFITWPVWTGPIALTAVVVVASRRAVPIRQRLRWLAAGFAPLVLVAAAHSAGRLGRLGLAGASGFVVRPSAELFGWPLVAAAVVGLAAMARTRRGGPILWLVFFVLAQSAALWAIARAHSADTPYLAFKMFYLLPYPMAVAAGCALALLWNRTAPLPVNGRLAWIVTAAVLVVVSVRLSHRRQPRPVITADAWRAGRWARDHIDRACVDYLVADGYTGYWLHLAVLDNPRDTPRVAAPDTFDPARAVARWVEPDGLPYAIVDDVNGFARALFNGTDTLADFGNARVIRRRGIGICPR
jgi:hypothetical protein